MALEADPYRTLGLSRGASLDEVKRAYRRLAKVNHPDAAGPGALARFLAIHTAYEQIAGSSTTSGAGGRPPGTTTPRRRPPAADQDRTEATRRAYGGRPREPRRGGRQTGGRSGTAPGAGTARPRESGPTERASSAGSTGASQGKATLGSTSYDGADSGPFEPDWGGASWYGTTSGTYWTINPKEYADPRKHGPEYQARARRAASTRAAGASAAAGPAAPTHTTSSWWDSTSGPAATADSPRSESGPAVPSRRPRHTDGTFGVTGQAPDPARAAADLGRALTDARSGGRRGRVVRAVVAWLPIGFGLGLLVGELTGCGRFAATCDPSVAPLTAVGQVVALGLLLLLPEIASLAAGAALALLVTAVAASLVLSATGAAANEGSRQAALGVLLVLAWLAGLAIAIGRRVRLGPARAGPVS